tara:strand:- start:484 stop:639 length:156 start_codon:yes stop_codon:yes gene_type:complete
MANWAWRAAEAYREDGVEVAGLLHAAQEGTSIQNSPRVFPLQPGGIAEAYQ